MNDVAMSPEEFGELHGICRAEVYKQIKAGRIFARKNGRRTVIYGSDNAKYRKSLPLLNEKTKSFSPRGGAK